MLQVKAHIVFGYNLIRLEWQDGTPSVEGGLSVFAFHEVPSRRFVPRFICFLRLTDAFGGKEITFLPWAPL